MSTWDGKPNDYDHAVALLIHERNICAKKQAEIERLQEAYAKMCVVLHEFVGGFDTLETAAKKLRAKFKAQALTAPE